MTREEAKSFLIDISYKLGNMSVEYLTEKDGEKMREAVKVLDQESCKDAVSRQAVLDLVADYDLSMGQVVKGIHELPPVNPQPKTGYCNSCKWYDEDVIYNPNCENCCRNYKDNYCGAKMVGMPESEDKTE